MMIHLEPFFSMVSREDEYFINLLGISLEILSKRLFEMFFIP